MFDRRNRSPKVVAFPASKDVVTAVILLVVAVANRHASAEDLSPSSSVPPWKGGGRPVNPEIIRTFDLSSCARAGVSIVCPDTSPQAIYALTPEEFNALQNAKHPSQTDLDAATKALVDTK
jgi:hypothetical protein